MNSGLTSNHFHFNKWTNQVLSDALVRKVWMIAEASFPPEERETCPVFLQSIENGRSVLYTAGFRDSIVGFTKLTPLGQSRIYLMEYLAVVENIRNQGLGSQILTFVRNDLSAQPDAGILLEVEPPLAVSGKEQELRQRRIRFYQRHGAALIMDYDAYRMPNLAGEGSLWMHLMWLPVKEDCQPSTSLTLAGLIKLIYQETYPGEEFKKLLNEILLKIPSLEALIVLGKYT
jgi:GNAT superfamily N-acetyltransferase